MKLTSIKLENFKNIIEDELYFDNKSTVFFGINGVGKSTILRAINLLFSSIINKIVQNRFKQGINIELDDIRYGSSKCGISLNMELDDKSFKYGRFMVKQNRERTHNKENLDLLCNKFNSIYLTNNEANMPMYANYSVNRNVIDIPLRIANKHNFDKISAFEKAIENKIDFRTFFEWFRNQEDYENEIKVRENSSFSDIQLNCVKYAILTMLDGFSDLRVERNPLRLSVKKNGINLRIEQLSDGEKCTLAMIGDLARRLALANPSHENPLKGYGIVLIDEIELHMHPIWQRRIINTLTDIFPNVQFFITTHSPQVLGELGSNLNIFKILNNDNKFQYQKYNTLDAWDTNYILEEFMNTSSLNLATKGHIAKMYELIAEKNYKEAEIFLNILEGKTDSAHEDVIKARILIARGLAKK